MLGRRHLREPGDPDAIRHRAGRAPALARDPRPGGSPRRRREPRRSFGGRHRLRLPRAGSGRADPARSRHVSQHGTPSRDAPDLCSGCRIPAAIRRPSRSTSSSCDRAREASCDCARQTPPHPAASSCPRSRIPPTPSGSARHIDGASSSPTTGDPTPVRRPAVTRGPRRRGAGGPHPRGGLQLPARRRHLLHGPGPNAGAVVDTAGHVHGTERLSVIDASIVPNGPSAFTHIPTIMLAERLCEQLADRIDNTRKAAHDRRDSEDVRLARRVDRHRRRELLLGSRRTLSRQRRVGPRHHEQRRRAPRRRRDLRALGRLRPVHPGPSHRR